jgi:hypothetical protein
MVILNLFIIPEKSLLYNLPLFSFSFSNLIFCAELYYLPPLSVLTGWMVKKWIRTVGAGLSHT